MASPAPNALDDTTAPASLLFSRQFDRDSRPAFPANRLKAQRESGSRVIMSDVWSRPITAGRGLRPTSGTPQPDRGVGAAAGGPGVGELGARCVDGVERGRPNRERTCLSNHVRGAPDAAVRHVVGGDAGAGEGDPPDAGGHVLAHTWAGFDGEHGTEVLGRADLTGVEIVDGKHRAAVAESARPTRSRTRAALRRIFEASPQLGQFRIPADESVWGPVVPSVLIAHEHAQGGFARVNSVTGNGGSERRPSGRPATYLITNRHRVPAVCCMPVLRRRPAHLYPFRG